MPDEPTTPPTRKRSGFRRNPLLQALAILACLPALYALPWYAAYLGGSYVVGMGDLDACIAMARRHEPDLAGVAWARRTTTEEEQRRDHVVHQTWLFGLVQVWTEGGTVEAIGTRDGRERIRLSVLPGPLGIGWRLARVSFPPPRLATPRP